jgi:hypothetical protein
LFVFMRSWYIQCWMYVPRYTRFTLLIVKQVIFLFRCVPVLGLFIAVFNELAC